MTLFRLDPVNGTHIDAAVAAVSVVTLTRRREGAYAEVNAGEAQSFIKALAFAGVGARPHGDGSQRGDRLVASVGTDLEPCTIPDIDSVRVRRLDLGEATAEVSRRRLAWMRPLSASARDRCRSLLRGDDVLLAWRRVAWADREAYRSAAVRRSLRPVVFDRSAVARGPEGRLFARDGALTKWLFG